MSTALEIISFFILLAPVVWEYGDDRHGDFNKKQDVLIRSTIAAVACFVNWLITHYNPLAIAFMCFALFILIFDYAIATRFAPHGKWFSYLGNGWIDNIAWWRNMNPWYRFGVRLVVFAAALIIYF